jgi:hypothetical protein
MEAAAGGPYLLGVLGPTLQLCLITHSSYHSPAGAMVPR